MKTPDNLIAFLTLHESRQVPIDESWIVNAVLACVHEDPYRRYDVARGMAPLTLRCVGADDRKLHLGPLAYAIEAHKRREERGVRERLPREILLGPGDRFWFDCDTDLSVRVEIYGVRAPALVSGG